MNHNVVAASNIRPEDYGQAITSALTAANENTLNPAQLETIQTYIVKAVETDVEVQKVVQELPGMVKIAQIKNDLEVARAKTEELRDTKKEEHTHAETAQKEAKDLQQQAQEDAKEAIKALKAKHEASVAKENGIIEEKRKEVCKATEQNNLPFAPLLKGAMAVTALTTLSTLYSTATFSYADDELSPVQQCSAQLFSVACGWAASTVLWSAKYSAAATMASYVGYDRFCKRAEDERAARENLDSAQSDLSALQKKNEQEMTQIVETGQKMVEKATVVHDEAVEKTQRLSQEVESLSQKAKEQGDAIEGIYSKALQCTGEIFKRIMSTNIAMLQTIEQCNQEQFQQTLYSQVAKNITLAAAGQFVAGSVTVSDHLLDVQGAAEKALGNAPLQAAALELKDDDVGLRQRKI